MRERGHRGVLRRDDDDALDALAEEPFHRVQHRPAVQRRQAGDRHEVAVVRRPLEAVQHGGWPVQHGVEADHAQRVGSPGDQRPGRGVRPVGELADGGEHLVPGRRANVRMVVENPGHGLVGDPGQPRDVGHDRRPGPVLPGPLTTDAVRRLLALSPGDRVTSCLPCRALRSGQPGPTLALTSVQVKWRCEAYIPPTATGTSPPPPGFPASQRSRRTVPAVPAAARPRGPVPAAPRRPVPAPARPRAGPSRRQPGPAGFRVARRRRCACASGLVAVRRAVPQVAERGLGLAAGLAVPQVPQRLARLAPGVAVPQVPQGLPGLAPGLALAQVTDRRLGLAPDLALPQVAERGFGLAPGLAVPEVLQRPPWPCASPRRSARPAARRSAWPTSPVVAAQNRSSPTLLRFERFERYALASHATQPSVVFKI